MHACALNLLSKKDAEGAIICIQDNIDNYNQDFDKTLEYCLKNRVEDIQRIKNCANSKEGNQLEHKMAQKTPAEHQYVPWITVDGVHDVAKEDHIMESLNNWLDNVV